MKERKEGKGEDYGYRSPFMHGDCADCYLMVVGGLGAVGDGLSIPIIIFLRSYMFNSIGRATASPTFIQDINKIVYIYLYVAAAALFAIFLDFISSFMNFLGCYIVAFILLWRLTLVVLPTVLLLVIPGLIYGRKLMELSREMGKEYNRAVAIVEQAISSVRTVYSFGAELRTTAAFSGNLDGSVTIGLRQGLVKGLAIGSSGINYAIWALIVWYGSRLVMHHNVKGGTAFIAGFAILRGGLSFGKCLSNLKPFGEAVSIAQRMNAVIDGRRMIGMEEDGEEMAAAVVKGEVEFREVRFAYPASPETEVIKGLNLKIGEGKTVALVGGSGAGKSTVIALLQRFYEPTGGEILFDGVEMRRLRVKWVRAQMGLVSQEPVLFSMSIKENILFGKEDATMDDVVAAAGAANATGFIARLPQGYDTQTYHILITLHNAAVAAAAFGSDDMRFKLPRVGERGLQLSGGQKQRIAIARAIIRSPKILLLDEATSALDYESEHIVQEALQAVTAGRTTLVIAHRLSTIRNAHTIAVVHAGKIAEHGTHEELISNAGGHYYRLLVSSRELTSSSDPTNNDDAACSPLKLHNRKNSSGGSHSSLSRSLDRPELSFAKEDDDAEQAKAVKDVALPSFWKLLYLSKPEWRQAALGCTGALLNGAVKPAYGYMLGTIASIYFLKDHDEIREKTRACSIFLLGLSLFVIVVSITQHYNLAAMGEYLTKRIRVQMLSKILTFEVSWFDREENSTGALFSRLSKDARVVRLLVGDRMSLIIQTLSTMAISICAGLLIAWKLTLVILSLQPFIILCYYTRYILLKRMSKKSQKAQMESGKLTTEAIHNFRTVSAFSSQDQILRLFEISQAEPHRDNILKAWIAGVSLGLSRCIIICTVSFSLWYGSMLISHGDITPKQCFQTFTIFMGFGRVMAEAATLTSDLSKSAATGASIFAILNRPSLIEPDDSEGCRVESVNGDIELHNVEYAYPSRPTVPVLRGCSLSIKAGFSTALVGQSGSGKSTVIGLIERFYDPLRGEVRIDGKDIRSFNLLSLRQHIALVGQEPVLFAGTVKHNITYGVLNANAISDAEVEAAARAANAHEFICGLPKGYEASCGEHGEKLSGGQKQRIAIARAILCDRSILLLDEATSAIDGQSEMIVKEALERLMVGRTTVVVAHKLSTVKNCHAIAVLEKGVVVEKGDHASLMKRQVTGKYYNLFLKRLCGYELQLDLLVAVAVVAEMPKPTLLQNHMKSLFGFTKTHVSVVS
ncbi:putative multidrug resistance protein [Platanthera zijinensis]|uniref:Multidrug resistance protein n=1 Tax=Platanthera zijinensis TaxID=2320716 RepID=A0AAP0B5Y2_9ASPA